MSTITNNTTAGTGAVSSTEAAKSALNGTLSDFLKLLTVQLQNQDPTEPADTNDITQQIASLSQVEQQINTNTKLDNLMSLLGGNQISAAVGYIGKQIDAPGNESVLAGGGAIFIYDLPAEAAEVTVTIQDSTGKTVYSGDASGKSGRNEILWDGSTSSGGVAADGVYKFTVTAKDAAGEDLKATTYTTGLVSSVDTIDGVTYVSLGLGLMVPLSDVQSVRTITGVGTEPPPAEDGGDDTADAGDDTTDETTQS